MFTPPSKRNLVVGITHRWELLRWAIFSIRVALHTDTGCVSALQTKHSRRDIPREEYYEY